MHVAVSRMEHVADGNPVFLADLFDGPQRFRDLRARNHAVLHVVCRTDAPDRSERVFAALPQQVPLLGRLRHAHFARSASAAHLRDRLACSSTASVRPFQLDQQHRRRV